MLLMNVLTRTQTHINSISSSLGTAARLAHTRMIQRPATANDAAKTTAVPIVTHIVFLNVRRTQAVSPLAKASLKAGQSEGIIRVCTTAR
jgi:hypothetical protein